MTWFVKANAELERHLSMVAIPKLIKCYDCDKNFHRDELVCDCSTSPMAAYGAAVQAQGMLCSFHEKNKKFFLHFFINCLSTFLCYYRWTLSTQRLSMSQYGVSYRIGIQISNAGQYSKSTRIISAILYIL